ncbi:MAG: hypothetical protein M1821_007454 [Bathelium mastoideum]|nr:MAG: hypothetical protein M1821_007454 [Bathelium mastoideum]KAI9694956.1 MAG: hypothetical protein M1822_000573 [Bathelium mastoideum]
MAPLTLFFPLLVSVLSLNEVVIANPIAKLSPGLSPRTSSNLKISAKTLKASRAPSEDKVTDAHLTLRRVASKSHSFSYVRSARNILATGSAPLTAVESGQSFDVQIQFADTTPVSVIVDSGSSDTWLAQSGFQCVDENGDSQAESACNFGPLFNGTFEDGQVANENFNIEYGDGEALNGVLGYEDVTVAGITVPHQEVALVNYAFWEGDGVSSGLLGLAFPALTSAFAGNDPANDNTTDNIEYSPIFTSMVNQSLLDAPEFSLAIERAPSAGGYIAFGGLPNISFTQDFTSTPIDIVNLVDEPNDATQYSFYTIVPSGFSFEGAGDVRAHRTAWHETFSNRESQITTIVDSGTTLVYLPDEIAEAVNALFEPSAVYLEDEGAFFADCQATAPTFGVNINGTTFNVNAADLLLQSEVDPETGLCLTGVQAGGEGPFILGDVFLQNVVAVYDVGAAEMRFAPHENY